MSCFWQRNSVQQFLFTFRHTASDDVYTTYGAVYTATSLARLWAVQGMMPAWTDVVPINLALCGGSLSRYGDGPSDILKTATAGCK
jgi:drug/metabolite transporter superfamily protein YnfA